MERVKNNVAEKVAKLAALSGLLKIKASSLN